MITKRPVLLLFASLVLPATLPGNALAEGNQVDYDPVSQGTRRLDRKDGADFLKILVESANLGGDEVEIAEITFPAGYRGNPHPHGSIEIFYVLSGQLTHLVDGEGGPLQPGEIGIVRPGDQVEHINETDALVKTLVIWVPGGEIARSFGSAEMVTIEPYRPK